MKIAPTKADIALAATNGHCWYCGTVLEMPNNAGHGARCANWFVLDHVTPRSMGGSNSQDNLVACCWRCNSQKNNKSREQYRAYLLRESIGMPRFNETQLSWLLAHGFVMPPHEPIVFWAERPENQVTEVMQ